MKKGYLLIAALALVLMMFQVPDAKAATLWNWDEDDVVVTQGPYTYHAYTSANDKKCWIYWIEIDPSKVHKATKLSIPSKLKGRTVTRIGYDFPEEDEDAEFYNNIFGVGVEEAHECDGYSSKLRNLKEITIPKTVNRIEPTCFSGVDYVKTIKIPPKVKKIFGETFYGCDNLEKIVLPKKLEMLIPAAFQDCPKLKKMELSSKNKTYRVKNGVLIEKETDKAIWALPSKKKVSIPKGVKILGNQVLAYGDVKKVVIPASVQEVGAQAFENSSIKKISIDPASKFLARDGQCIYSKIDQSLVVAMPDAKGYFRISDKVTLLPDSASVAGGKVKVMVVSASVKGVGLGGFHLNRLGVMEKVYFLGTEPPKILESLDYYAALPIFTDVYVLEEADAAYKAWYEQYDCLDYVDSWNIFKPSDLNK